MPTRSQRRQQHWAADNEMRLIRKDIKHNRKPKGANRKETLPARPDDLEQSGTPQVERVMPRGERERRRAVLATALTKLEAGEAGAGQPKVASDAGWTGVVVEVSSSLCRVDMQGREVMCGLRGSLSARDTGFTNVIAVGDRVSVSEDGAGRGVVNAVLPRTSVLARPDVFRAHLQQVVVANADQLLIVASWRAPVIWLELVDRYLIAAARNNLRPVICVNKVDLAQDEAICRRALQPYLDLGYRVLFTSALTGAGLQELRGLLQDQTTALAGMSGVGKSSLLTAIQPDLNIRINRVSEHSGEGRHTTSQVTLLKLAMGGYVVDTPGIREFGLSGLRKPELAQFYSEIETAARGCRFGDCSHQHEPGCAVQAAVQQGRVSEARYHSYSKIRATLPD